MSIGAVVEPYTQNDLSELRRQSKSWNPMYIGHRLLATIAARDAEISGLNDVLATVSETLGEVICAGTLAPGEKLAAPSGHAAVSAILRKVEERDAALARVAELETFVKEVQYTPLCDAKERLITFRDEARKVMEPKP